MKQNGKYALLVTLALGAVLLAADPAGLGRKIILPSAAALAIIASLKLDWVNGVFISLIFGFTYFSTGASSGPADFIIITAVFSAFSVLAGRIKMLKSGKEQKPATSDEERAFINKVINSFMLAHDMLWEFSKGTTREEISGIFARNVENLIKVEHTLLYMKDNEAENPAYKLSYSRGAEGDFAVTSVPAREMEDKYLRDISTAEYSFVKKRSNQEMHQVIIPLKDEKGVKEAVLLVKKEPFDHSDLYIAEFFAAQIFIIIQKNELFTKLKDNYEKIIEALSIAIDTKDHETHGHSLATMRYAMQMAEKLKLSEEEKERIRYASLLHDIGKINISNSILNKPSSLTAEEFEEIKKHPSEGVNILSRLDIFNEILPIILYHHEHFDGKGYPKQLKGEEIPLGSRICAIADAYSVMRSNRPYRNALSKEQAVKEMKRCAGTQFDSSLIGLFLELINEEEIPRDGNGTAGRGPVKGSEIN